jgi:hypothetical protein
MAYVVSFVIVNACGFFEGIQPPQPSHNLSQSRLIVARRMVRRAFAVLQRLEWPGIQESPDPETPPEDVENGR